MHLPKCRSLVHKLVPNRILISRGSKPSSRMYCWCRLSAVQYTCAATYIWIPPDHLGICAQATKQGPDICSAVLRTPAGQCARPPIPRSYFPHPPSPKNTAPRTPQPERRTQNAFRSTWSRRQLLSPHLAFQPASCGGLSPHARLVTGPGLLLLPRRYVREGSLHVTKLRGKPLCKRELSFINLSTGALHVG